MRGQIVFKGSRYSTHACLSSPQTFYSESVAVADEIILLLPVLPSAACTQHVLLWFRYQGVTVIISQHQQFYDLQWSRAQFYTSLTLFTIDMNDVCTSAQVCLKIENVFHLFSFSVSIIFISFSYFVPIAPQNIHLHNFLMSYCRFKSTGWRVRIRIQKAKVAEEEEWNINNKWKSIYKLNLNNNNKHFMIYVLCWRLCMFLKVSENVEPLKFRYKWYATARELRERGVNVMIVHWRLLMPDTPAATATASISEQEWWVWDALKSAKWCTEDFVQDSHQAKHQQQQ